MKNIFVPFLIVGFSLSTSASPVSDSLAKAKLSKIPYGIVELALSNPNSSNSIQFNKLNNLGYGVGFDLHGELFSSSGSSTGYFYGEGFIVTPDGVKTPIKNITGINFIPQAINDLGQIAGVTIDLASNTPVTPIIYSATNGVETIEGLPVDYDQVIVKDINQNGTVLLTSNILKTPGNGPTPARYVMKTFLAKRGSNNRYTATEVTLPALPTSSERTYVPLRAPLPNDYNLYPLLSGLLSQFLTDDEVILGDTYRAGGFSHSSSNGTNYLFPGTGAVSEEMPFTNIGSIPVSLSLNQTFLTTNSLIGIKTQSQLVDYQFYNSTLVSASSDGRVVGYLNDYSNQGITIQKDGLLRNIECAMPNSQRISSISPLIINSNGRIIATASNDDTKATNTYLLTPNPDGQFNNYCANVSFKYLGKCGNIKDASDHYTIKRNSVCTLQITVKDSVSLPIAKTTVVLKNDLGKTVAKGTTDKKGKIKFQHKIYNSGSFSVIAPFGSKTYRKQENSFYVSIN